MIKLTNIRLPLQHEDHLQETQEVRLREMREDHLQETQEVRLREMREDHLQETQEVRLREAVARHLRVPLQKIRSLKILKRSLDARKKHRLCYVYSLEVYLEGEAPPPPPAAMPTFAPLRPRPAIIGCGPGGLFAALRLLDHGIPSVIFERGSQVHPRTVKINRFWKSGVLDPETNVCFGEGGAGLFSDGKLITRIKSPFISYVLRRLVDFGAPPEITYVSNPHVGSNRLRKVITRLAQYLRDSGCEIHFDTRVERLLMGSSRRIEGLQLADGRQIPSTTVLAATGHSARDFYTTLHEQGVALEAKDYAMGVRIEHPQPLINRIQLGDHPPTQLGAAAYKLTYNSEEARVYSFCMCPGGYVLSAATEADGVVVNGMSNYSRGSRWSNSALVVPVVVDSIAGSEPFRGLELQRKAERQAFLAVRNAGGSKELPAQRLTDFLEERVSSSLPSVSSPSGAVSVNLLEVLPSQISEALKASMAHFHRQMKGFICDEAVLFAVESRTSAPLRIPRDPRTLQSANTPGLYPVGEGAGYAGGITSSAVDGIRAVEALLANLAEVETSAQ